MTAAELRKMLENVNDSAEVRALCGGNGYVETIKEITINEYDNEKLIKTSYELVLRG